MEGQEFRVTVPAKQALGLNPLVQVRLPGPQLLRSQWATIHNPWARICCYSLLEATASTRHPALQVLVVVMVVLVMGTVMEVTGMATVTRANNGDIEVLLHEKKLFAMIAANIGS